MQRLVTRTTTRHQTDLARPRCVAAIDDAVGMINTHLRPGSLDAEQRLRNDVLGVVDELLHSGDPSLHYDGRHASPTRQRRWPLWHGTDESALCRPLLLNAAVFPDRQRDHPGEYEQCDDRVADEVQVDVGDCG